ncbi:two-component system, cell cycle sensor histidine kinase and response regulator CckA [Azospirillaceae bacterium]
MILAAGAMSSPPPSICDQTQDCLLERRYRRFFEETPIGIALVNNDGILKECNPTFKNMIESGRDNVLGQPVDLLLHPDNRHEILHRLKSVAAGENASTPLWIRLPNHQEQVGQLFVCQFETEAKTNGMILHLVDMTEQKRLETKTAQSQKMQAIGQLTGGIAHDFNNLLTAMIGFCDLLLLRHKPGDVSFPDLMQIKQNANRAASLIRQLLAFSRQQTMQPKIINLSEVLSEITTLLRRLIGENIDLKMIHGQNPWPIKVDQGQLEQVIINLAVNARDAMPNGGCLTVTTRRLSLSAPILRQNEEAPPGDYVAIDVRDTGVGIPPENLSRIFEPFFSTKEAGLGTGLGLSTAYGIIHQTGGFLFVDSTPNQGTCFSILLPRYQGPVLAPEITNSCDNTATFDSRERTPNDSRDTTTILLVEDEDAVRIFSARALRNKGYRVLEAKNGEAALATFQAEKSQIDLLITDVVMPQMDGPTLIRHVRKYRPTLKVIFISGYAEDRFRDQIDSGLPIYFLPKPFSLKQLAAQVQEIIHPSEEGLHL